MVRAVARLCLVAVSILVLVVSWLLPLMIWPFSERIGSRLRAHQLHIWAKVCLWIMGVRVRRQGTPPKAPFFLVTNHLGYMDVPVIWSQVETYFLGKTELARWPLLGPLIRLAGTLFIDRNRKTGVIPAIEGIERRLRLGNGVVVFPEGTSSSGGRILRLRRNLFEVPLRTGLPVHVACLHYAVPDPRHPVEMKVCWWGDMTFPPHLWGILRIPRIEVRMRFDEVPVTGASRRELAAAATERMERMFEPMHDWSRVQPEEDEGIPD